MKDYISFIFFSDGYLRKVDNFPQILLLKVSVSYSYTGMAGALAMLWLLQWKYTARVYLRPLSGDASYVM